jgi:hypothetical protein
VLLQLACCGCHFWDGHASQIELEQQQQQQQQQQQSRSSRRWGWGRKSWQVGTLFCCAHRQLPTPTGWNAGCWWEVCLMSIESDRNGCYVLQRTSKLPPWDLVPGGKPPGGWPLLLLSCPFLSMPALCSCAILTTACSPSRRYGTPTSTKPPVLHVLRYRWTASWCMRTQRDRHTLGRCLRNTPSIDLLLLRPHCTCCYRCSDRSHALWCFRPASQLAEGHVADSVSLHRLPPAGLGQGQTWSSPAICTPFQAPSPTACLTAYTC